MDDPKRHITADDTHEDTDLPLSLEQRARLRDALEALDEAEGDGSELAPRVRVERGRRGLL